MWRDHLGALGEAAAGLGLLWRDTEFLEVPAEDLYALAAMRVPGMYHHWSFGRNYELERTRHDRGRGTIHELVVNLSPARAYLLDQNSAAEHVFVAAHVLGHVDLFCRNCFARQQRLDLDEVLLGARTRFAAYEGEYGAVAVEAVLDAAHAVMWHATPLPLAEPRPVADGPGDPYRGLFPSAEGVGAAEVRRQRADLRRWSRGIGESDLLRFLIAHAPLQPWQADVLGVVREVALYLAPQARIKVLHEGWASFWHRRLLRAVHALPESDVQDARLHARVVGDAGGGRNPYWLGLTLLEHLDRQGVDLLALAAQESDRSLLERVDEALLAQEPVLGEWARALEARDGAAGGARPWERVRDLLLAGLPQVPEVDVEVREWDARRLVLQAAVAVDLAYARQVLGGLARLWGGEAVLTTPTQQLAAG